MKTSSLEKDVSDSIKFDVFIRKACRNKDGKSHHYWILLESYRTVRGPRHRTVAYLDEMDEAGRLGLQHVAQNHPAYQCPFFQSSTPEWVEVDVGSVRTERARRFGDVWLGLELVKILHLDQFFQEALNGRQANSLLREFEVELLRGAWKRVHPGLEVKLCQSPFGNPQEVFILCRSTARQAKEKAIHDRFLGRLEAGLRRLERSCACGRVRSVRMAERRCGRLLERYHRASRLFSTAVEKQNGRVKFSWSRREQQLSWARRSEGCYVLRSNVKEWSPQELWKAYIQLTDAEKAFRIHKDALRLRPIWHQKESRVQAHVLVCFLAYVLWTRFGRMCRQAGLGDEPRKIIEEIKKLQLVVVVLPTRKGAEICLRCVTAPDPELAFVLQKLKLKPPKRLNINPDL